MSYIINLFGNGIRYWVCDTDAPILEPLNALRLQRSLRWDQVLFDLSLLNRHGIDHWSSLSQQGEKLGFVLSDQNRIEIKKASKLIQRFHSIELYNDQTLFPRFQTNTLPFPDRSTDQLIILQFETGLLGKYRFTSDQIQMEDLNFMLERPIPQENDLLLTGITHRGNALVSEQEDTVVRGLRVIEDRPLR